MNLLIDTNVLIDYVGGKPPFCAAAQQVFAAGFFGDVKLWVPALSLKDAFYVLSKYVDGIEVQEKLAALQEVIDLVVISGEETFWALHLKWEDHEDCLMALCADKVKADYIVTRDTKGYVRSLVPIITPEELLKKLRDDHGLAYGQVNI